MGKNYWIWFVLALAIFVFAIITAGGNMLAYISIPALMAVVAPPAFLNIAVYGPRGFGRSFRIAFRDVVTADSELKNAIAMFKGMQKQFIIAGLIATMIGIIAILTNLESAEAGGNVGSYVSLALITLLYALIFALSVTIPFSLALRKRLVEHQTWDSVDGISG